MSSTYAPVDHPGVTVPVERRAWSTPWPHYRPVDITPPRLRPAALATPSDWVRDPQSDPAQIQDWDQRLERAVVPYRLDSAGRPLNPTGRTGRCGRNLKSWGENAAADPIVIAGTGADRSVLLIRRGDNGLWAIPGGMVDPGETVEAALVRELGEETGVDLTGRAPDVILRRGYVEDWRATDHAWVASTAALFLRPETVPAQGADDALEARWWPLTSVDRLVDDLVPHGGLYAAHIPLLTTADSDQRKATMTCADLDCEEESVHRLRYQAPEGEYVYDLCERHLDRAHHWLAGRPHLALTAMSERLTAPVDQPALF